MNLDLSKLTRRARIRLTLMMVSPLRCGGIHYDDQGIPRTKTGANWNEIVAQHEQKRQAELNALDKLTDVEFEEKYPRR